MKHLLNKKGFTLAETMIALVIIGVIAAVTLPAVMNHISSKEKAEKIRNVRHKLSHSTDKMLGVSTMSGYTSTEDFLNSFKHHMSISKVCKPDSIQDCWGSKIVTLTSGRKYEISNVKRPSNLRLPSTDEYREFGDIMGFVMNDGTPFIISYNKKCDMTLSDGKVWASDISSSTNCISGVFDYNGGKKPNKLGEDVINFNLSSGLGGECAFEVGNNCYTASQAPTPASKAECTDGKSTLGIKVCSYNTDYWAGAVKQCGGVDKMVGREDLVKIAEEIYGGKMSGNSSSTNQTITGTFTADNPAAIKYGITPGQIVWSGEEYVNDGIDAYSMTFYPNGASYYNGMGSNGFLDTNRSMANIKFICKAE